MCESLLIQPYDVPAPVMQVHTKPNCPHCKGFAIFNFRDLLRVTWRERQVREKLVMMGNLLLQVMRPGM